MSQNLVSVSFSEANLAAIDGALAVLDEQFAGLLHLTADERRALTKMGDKSEAFCRQTLTVLAQNTQLVPPTYDLAEAQRDLAALDALRARTVRLHQLLHKAEDTETALGSDVMTAALEGYALLKVFGKGAGLETLRQGMSARFARGTKSKPAADQSKPAADPNQA